MVEIKIHLACKQWILVEMVAVALEVFLQRHVQLQEPQEQQTLVVAEVVALMIVVLAAYPGKTGGTGGPGVVILRTPTSFTT